MEHKFVIAVYVDNKAGVLTRVTAMFTRRGLNIDALTVGETEHPEYSRITIAISGDAHIKTQLINQLKKLLSTILIVWFKSIWLLILISNFTKCLT